MDFLIQTLITFLVVIDPIGTIPIFIGLTANMSKKHRFSMAWRGVLFSWIILILFAYVGQSLLENLGISIAAFRIAGGLFLFVIAFEMLFDKRTQRKSKSANEMHHPNEQDADDDDISVFPLAMPLLAGPGAITAVLLLASDYDNNSIEFYTMLFSLSAILLLCLIGFIFSNTLQRLVGDTFNHILTRLLGMLLAALACQFVIDGILSAFAN